MENKIKMSSSLQKAREYEKNETVKIPIEQKPSFHACSPVGWINDPNGFSIFQDEVHLMCQYHPYTTQWGPMHWAHYKSKDFIKWELLPVCMAPDQEYDSFGCFSGSAIEHDGKHVLVYTGVVVGDDEEGKHFERQTQCLAIGDGVDYEKSDVNPIIGADMLPDGASKVDFRDPKIWKDENTFYVIVGNRNEDGSGQLLLYSSEDLKQWKYCGVVDKCENRYGKMWECPDMFPLEGKYVILTSPQDMCAEGLEFHSGNGTLCLIGDFDKEQVKFERETESAIDYGLDFYASQTTETKDGRRIMIAWMQSWDNYNTPGEFRWSGQMTVPRELHIKNGRLYQLPVKELENYYANTVNYKDVIVHEAMELEGVSGREIDMTIDIQAGDYEEFRIQLAKSQKFYTEISYNAKKGILTFDRNHAGSRRDFICQRSMKVESQDGKIRLRVVMDKYSVEIFANDGEKAMTSLIYTPMDADKILFKTDGTAYIDIVKHDVVVE